MKLPIRCPAVLLSSALLFLAAMSPLGASSAGRPPASGKAVSGQAILHLTQEFLQVAPKRYIGSPGHAKAEEFIKAHFAPEIATHNFIQDDFSASTPLGRLPMRNLIVKFPGKKDGVIALVTHYETNYPLKDVDFVGANDGACTTAMLIALGEYFRAHPPQGYSVWLVFDDGEEAIANPPINPSQWTSSNSLYGTRHLAAKWSADGTAQKIKAVLIADMLGDKDLNILEELQSTEWLRDLLRKASHETNHTVNVFKAQGAEDDDHLPFLTRGMPALDIIDVDYGPHTASQPDGYHHTPQDTLDKLSAASLQTSADLFLAMVRLIDQRP